MSEQGVNITENAAQQVRKMLDGRGTPDAAIRLGVGTSGCSGFSYKLEYADEVEEGDEVYEAHGIKLVVDSKSLLYIAGTEMDYVTENFKSGFTFRNPKEQSRCGCGESFKV
uniref:Iron-binding protein iscA. FeS cluster assembly protein n=1 Tax=Magnetococcus massalia (strain MO-1) TaxID=451514 RepID=A0A1S7LCQ7_MAGMO|nr:Iron-binding protein iscA. FeS cluster assembly protein [Candidatus Magnetococcus massalia]